MSTALARKLAEQPCCARSVGIFRATADSVGFLVSRLQSSWPSFSGTASLFLGSPAACGALGTQGLEHERVAVGLSRVAVQGHIDGDSARGSGLGQAWSAVFAPRPQYSEALPRPLTPSPELSGWTSTPADRKYVDAKTAWKSSRFRSAEPVERSGQQRRTPRTWMPA